MSEAEFSTGIPEGVRAIAGPIVCHHAADGNAEACVVSHAGLQVFDGAGGFFVRMDLVEGDAGGIVHGDMDIFPADTAMERLALPASGDAMPGYRARLSSRGLYRTLRGRDTHINKNTCDTDGAMHS